jgi:hypothetical protein
MKAIEKNVPVLKPSKRVTELYPVQTMEIGDSFSLTVDEFKRDSDIIRQFSYNHGLRFSICRHGAANGYRVWRGKVSRKKSNRGRQFGKNRPRVFCSANKPEGFAIADPAKSREAWHEWLLKFGFDFQQSKT